MSALAQPTRLEVFTILARSGPEGLSAGALAQQANTPANTISAHLAILSRANLITSVRHGRSIVYKAVADVLKKLILFLLSECCDGDDGRSRKMIDRLRSDLEGAVT